MFKSLALASASVATLAGANGTTRVACTGYFSDTA